MSYLLTVIDMQPEFRASRNKETFDKVNNLIDQAVKDHCPIIFLEYKGYEATDSKLLATVKGYKRYHCAQKHGDDGSTQIKSIINKHKYLVNTLRVCGVNTNYCVRETVCSLVNNFSKIEVSRSGTNCSFYHSKGLSYMKSCHSVQLID